MSTKSRDDENSYSNNLTQIIFSLRNEKFIPSTFRTLPRVFACIVKEEDYCGLSLYSFSFFSSFIFLSSRCRRYFKRIIITWLCVLLFIPLLTCFWGFDFFFMNSFWILGRRTLFIVVGVFRWMDGYIEREAKGDGWVGSLYIKYCVCGGERESEKRDWRLKLMVQKNIWKNSFFSLLSFVFVFSSSFCLNP